MDANDPGHSTRMSPARATSLAATGPRSEGRPGDRVALPLAMKFDDVYETHFAFVWRTLRRLGVPESAADDAVQDVFVVVHRRLADFEGRSSLRTWLFGIAARVASDHRRALRRKGGLHEEVSAELPDASPGPHESAARSEAVRRLEQVLDLLDDDRRAVFVLADLEQLTAPEIAAALGVNVNTVYTRLRAARDDFNRALARQLRSTP